MKVQQICMGAIAVCVAGVAVAEPPVARECEIAQVVPFRLDASNDILRGGRAADFNVIVRNVSEDEGRNVFREGPMEVYTADEQQTYVCKIDQEMLQEPFAFVQNKYLYFAVMDASEVWLRALELKTCKIAWSSPVLTYRPKVAVDTFVLDDKTYTLNSATCLPEVKEQKTQTSPPETKKPE